MRKFLLSSVAVAGLVLAAPAAHADIELDVGGYFKGYGAFVDQDDDFGDVAAFDFIRDTEIHIGGETVLDNGLTIGAHFEVSADGADFGNIDESYVYFSGNWGRVNFGTEDGAAYLLQVAAPSADSNIDGLRQFVQPVNFTALVGAANAGNINTFGGVDYDQDLLRGTDSLTYLSPIFSGFQFGVSYSPDTDAASDLGGVGLDDVAGQIGQTYEIAARYEGQFNNAGVIVGAGFTQGDLEEDQAGADDRTQFNVGIDVDIAAFGIGVVYTEDDGGLDGAGFDDEETFVVGVDYTTGPFKIGASYFDQTNSFAVEDLDTTRYTGGVTYNYAPGMSFRGSVSYLELEGVGNEDVDATSLLLGTQINF